MLKNRSFCYLKRFLQSLFILSDKNNVHAPFFLDYSVHITYFLLDKNSYLTPYFLGFSVYISNTTNKEDVVLCFRDTNYTNATIPNPVNITCPYHGDTLSTTTTGLILRILRGILMPPGFSSVKWKCTVRNPICPDNPTTLISLKLTFTV